MDRMNQSATKTTGIEAQLNFASLHPGYIKSALSILRL
jgi:hypothetical protein